MKCIVLVFFLSMLSLSMALKVERRRDRLIVSRPLEMEMEHWMKSGGINKRYEEMRLKNPMRGV
ncbi:unnamed protein product [Cylicocyclus nassatus]|uniref:Uncharacterized protein n=1 Tax=Cylicocyclus nassatus TaxID=53992 RepID=A0AA36GPT3_CYLNA|nr:unnamed protein product [Cylicocyclus nassatus]